MSSSCCSAPGGRRRCVPVRAPIRAPTSAAASLRLRWRGGRLRNRVLDGGDFLLREGLLLPAGRGRRSSCCCVVTGGPGVVDGAGPSESENGPRYRGGGGVPVDGACVGGVVSGIVEGADSSTGGEAVRSSLGPRASLRSGLGEGALDGGAEACGKAFPERQGDPRAAGVEDPGCLLDLVGDRLGMSPGGGSGGSAPGCAMAGRVATRAGAAESRNRQEPEWASGAG